MKYLFSLLFSFLAYSLFAQIAVVNPDSVRLGNPAGNGSLSLAGKAYLKNVSEGTSSDSVLVRGADGVIKYVKRSTFAVAGIPLPNGLKILEINTQTVNYTILPLDVGKLVQLNQTNANTVSIPASSSSNIPIGTQIIIRQMGTGQTFVKGEIGVAIESSKGQALRAQYSTATLVKIATDVWALYGDLVVASPPIASNNLPGLYRVSPMPDVFSTDDNETYWLNSNYGQQIPMGYKMEGDGIILVKAPFGSTAYHCDIQITTAINGGDNTDFYFYNGSIVTEASYGSGGGFSEVIVEGTFYGLKKVGDNIKLVKTTDGLVYTDLVDFGPRPGFKYLVTWGYGGSTMLHPQGTGLSVVN
ncbi:hypothetical protein ACFOG5_17185 [Pedobacter fastidiosus]|uniref:IgGFc-binding protein N-terminal domain-containing protein n=1 Tax=Pedobacter fastidiosus TaxID=2765361 RepID=A0ABR7KRF3_9SPHI|nr:hypothetical protein [Pedobacter fastidiosus]MBC6110681.1 hypothetical protein [Pedobacter fastidiosus]